MYMCIYVYCPGDQLRANRHRACEQGFKYVCTYELSTVFVARNCVTQIVGCDPDQSSLSLLNGGMAEAILSGINMVAYQQLRWYSE